MNSAQPMNTQATQGGALEETQFKKTGQSEAREIVRDLETAF